MSLDLFDISSNGFLPNACLTKLPPFWQHFQTPLDNLSSEDGPFFRSLVDSLPKYDPHIHSISSLNDHQKRLVYTAITFIVQKYVWCCGKDHFLNTIPAELGLPLLAISKELNMPPVLNYAAVILYNWAPKDSEKTLSLDNLKVNFKLLDNPAYEWFSIIHAAIEARGGAVLKSMLDAKIHIENNNSQGLQKSLTHVIEALRATNSLLLKMYDNCSPDEFWKFRFYFEGTNDTTLFPKGLQIKGVAHEPIVYVGISGAQSTLIQAFDAFFSVVHEGHGKDFLEAMRNYMPDKHRKFIEELPEGLNVKDYVMNSGDKELERLFEDAINRFTVYRQTHLRLVHDYILMVINKKKAEAREKANQNGDTGLYKEDSVGTGGTDAQKLLQQTIQETRVTKTMKKVSTREKTPEEEERMTGKPGVDGKGMKAVVKFDRKLFEDILVSVIVGISGSFVVKATISSLIVN